MKARPRRRRRHACRLVASLLGVAILSGCGAESPEEPPPPTSPLELVQPDAIAVAGVQVQPRGELARSAAAGLGRLLDSPRPGHVLGEKFLAELDGPVRLRDVTPWLGRRVISYASAERSEETIMIVETTDSRAAMAAVRRVAVRDGSELVDASVEGVPYFSGRDGASAGTIGRFLILADEDGFAASVRAARGTSFADDPYGDSISELAEENLAFAYARLNQFRLVSSANEGEEADDQAVVDAVLGDLAEHPVLAAVKLSGSRLDVALQTGPPETLRPLVTSDRATTRLLRAQPESARVSFVLPKVNALSSRVMSAAPDLPGALRIVGLVLFGERLDLAGFVQGSSRRDLELALTYSVALQGAPQGVLLGDAIRAGLEGRPISPFQLGDSSGYVTRIPGVPRPVIYAHTPEGLVLSFGANAARSALRGPTLGRSADFRRAVAAQGADFEPLAYVSDASRLLSMLSGVDALGSEERWGLRAEALGELVVGNSGEENATRISLSLRDR